MTPGLWLASFLVAAVAADPPPPPVPLPESGDVTALAHEPAIRRELGLEPAEVAAVDRVYARLEQGRVNDRDAAGEVLRALRPDHRERLRQVRRRLLGGGAVLEPDVGEALGLRPAQRTALDRARRKAEAELAELLASARFVSAQAERLYVARFYRKAYAGLPAEVLDADQLGRLATLVGVGSEAALPLIARLDSPD